ncbi:MAG: hypothetical protein ACHQU0_03485, partial [Candidatus Paceibacteria bacterium]
GITPHSFTAWKRVQKSAPPAAPLLEAGFKSLEQQVIDASYRAYKRCRNAALTFEQWLTFMNLKDFIHYRREKTVDRLVESLLRCESQV